MKKKVLHSLKWIFTIFWFFLFFFAALNVYWFYRPNTAFINKDLDMEVNQAFEQEYHNSNTNLIYWKGDFYLVHQTSPQHWTSSESKIIIRKSSDGENFDKIIATLDYNGIDIRDPKFAEIEGKLFLYALPNKGYYGLPFNVPYTTVYSYSEDGKEWTDWEEIKGDAEGFNFWRPKTYDNITWYVTAHDIPVGGLKLFKSTNGKDWDKVSTIYNQDLVSETAMEFLPNGDIICVSRCEVTSGLIGDFRAYTLISVAESPYDEWEQEKSYVTKLDGPAIFLNPEDNNTYAVGRYEPEAKGVFTSTGSFFNKKRSSIFLLEQDKLVYLSDLPSGGDTSYFGTVVKGAYVYLSYYTSDFDRDYIWFQGMIMPSYIMVAKIKLNSLVEIADDPPLLYTEGFAFDHIFMILGYIAIIAALIYFQRRK